MLYYIIIVYCTFALFRGWVARSDGTTQKKKYTSMNVICNYNNRE